MKEQLLVEVEDLADPLTVLDAFLQGPHFYADRHRGEEVAAVSLKLLGDDLLCGWGESVEVEDEGREA